VTYEKIGTIQRRLAWPLHKDDTLSRSGRSTDLNIYFVCSFYTTITGTSCFPDEADSSPQLELAMSLSKRRKLDLEALESSFPDIIGEIDLEIGFREQLARTLESRITWALVLQEALQSGVCSGNPFV
jgi:hypothetical protein